MNMYDKSYCATQCDRKECIRNLKFHKPAFKYYSVAYFDQKCDNYAHNHCKYVISVKET